MEGIVFKSTGSWYSVVTTENTSYKCRIRGKIRTKGLKTTNPVAVGDRVKIFIEDSDQALGVIEELLPRTNYIIRQAVKKSSQAHIIAANIDLAMLIVTEVYPKTSLGFIDRFLVTAESFRIPQALIFNKTDLLNTEQQTNQTLKIDLYKNLGINCLETSAIDNQGIEALKGMLEGKKTLISGHSGVGKSTLINHLAPHLNQKTGDISEFAKKGVHTTTFAEMFDLNHNTFVIDTPGIKELGLIDIEVYELSDYFPEMRALSQECKFNNCVHLDEPGCEIKDALEDGRVSESRYLSYLSMIEGTDNRR
ncbi:MAG: ribosome small subunit-dependent GTPase A [Bacteroidota bacterium]